MEDTKNTLRKILFATAYKMTGELQTSEDIVQDVFTKYLTIDKNNIQNEKSYLIKMTINYTLNYLKRQKNIREHYHGTWLPEPVLQERADYYLDIDYGMTVLLSRLTPQERAVFILRTSFEYPHTEIGEMLELTPSHIRKLYQRAQPKVQKQSNAQPINAQEKKALVASFLEAIHTGNIQSLVTKLKADIVLYSDGGGKVAAAKVPLRGEVCFKFLSGLYQKYQGELTAEIRVINNDFGLLLFEKGNPQPLTIGIFEIENGQVQTIYFMRNPEKIHLAVTD